MIRQVGIALVAGLVFGAGLTVSGMVDPARVQGFLDLGGAWDPTLAFVMAGALAPMVVAWRLRRRMARPLASDRFHAPPTRPVTPALVAGGLLFGVGWGLSGLCPGPAVANLALAPIRVAPFLIAMIAGFALHRLATERPSRGRNALPARPGH